jgi:hypothetical protein
MVVQAGTEQFEKQAFQHRFVRSHDGQHARLAFRLEEEKRRNKGASRGHQEGVRYSRAVTWGLKHNVAYIRARERPGGNPSLIDRPQVGGTRAILRELARLLREAGSNELPPDTRTPGATVGTAVVRRAVAGRMGSIPGQGASLPAPWLPASPFAGSRSVHCS